MISRSQFNALHLARGLTVEEIIAKTGIPIQSLTVLLNEGDRDPNLLISSNTFKLLEHVLGLKQGMSGLRDTGVIEWRMPQSKEARKKWLHAVAFVRSELMGPSLEVAVIVRRKRLLGKYECSVLVTDAQSRAKIVATHVDKHSVSELLDIFGVVDPRTVMLDQAEYDLICQLVSNGVLRTQQFLLLLGGKLVRYTWPDVQAAAKELDFTTDDLILMMAQKVDAANRRSAASTNQVPADGIPILKVAAG